MKKIVAIGIMTVMCGLASICIRIVVNEREKLSDATQYEVSKSWSGSQKFAGPVLCVPVHEEGKAEVYTCMYVFPDKLNVDAGIKSDNLHRGIFEASVYTAAVKVDGTFNLKDMTERSFDPESEKPIWIDWQHAQIIVGISGARSLEESIHIALNDNRDIVLDKKFNNYGSQGLLPIFYYTDYRHSLCQPADLKDMLKSEVKFSLQTSLKGSEELLIATIGKDTRVSMRGNSSDPSFMGSSLPSTREISKEGFSATWKLNNIRGTDERIFCSNDSSIEFDTAGTRLLVRGGWYTQTDRALKYAFLVIFLSLAAVFLGEMSVNGGINVLNYFLIGAALVLFYLMLLSLSEWVGFGLAYLISAVLILGMIALYLKSIVRDKKTVAAVCLFMGLVDVFIYVLLSIADMALLVGSFGLFVVLGAAMFLSIRLQRKSAEASGSVESEDNVRI